MWSNWLQWLVDGGAVAVVLWVAGRVLGEWDAWMNLDTRVRQTILGAAAAAIGVAAWQMQSLPPEVLQQIEQVARIVVTVAVAIWGGSRGQQAGNHARIMRGFTTQMKDMKN